MDVGVAEPSAGGFLARKSTSINNFPSWLWSKMVSVNRRGSWAQTPLVLTLGCVVNVQLSYGHLVEHLPSPCQGAKSRFPWCGTLGFIPVGNLSWDGVMLGDGRGPRALSGRSGVARVPCPGGAVLLLRARWSRTCQGRRSRDGERLTVPGINELLPLPRSSSPRRPHGGRHASAGGHPDMAVDRL